MEAFGSEVEAPSAFCRRVGDLGAFVSVNNLTGKKSCERVGPPGGVCAIYASTTPRSAGINGRNGFQ
jgi:hypothetical protein